MVRFHVFACFVKKTNRRANILVYETFYSDLSTYAVSVGADILVNLIVAGLG